MVTCLLFDLDGTLFDTNEANIFAYTKAFERVGLRFDEKAYRSQFGLRFTEMLNEIAPSASPELRTQIKRLKAQFYRENLSLVRPNPMLLDIVKNAANKFLTGLVTTASRTNAHNLLAHFDIPLDTFNTIIVGEDVSKSKPDPECYLKAIEALGVTPEQCRVFEDSPHGIEAAKRAGTQVVKVRIL